MAKQTFTSGQVLTAAEMNSLQENDYNWTVTTKTASYTLAAGDEGTRIVMNNAGATTITVDDAVFSAGDVVWLHNIGAGTCTITAGTATVNTDGSLALSQYQGGQLFFTSAASAIFFPNVGAQAGGKILQVVRATDTTLRSTTSTSYVDANISVTITPTSATSNILLIWSLYASASSNRGVYILTDSSNVAIEGAEATNVGYLGANAIYNAVTLVGYDSPATTSATTYKGRFSSPSGVTVYCMNASTTGQLFALEISA
jgi:uncharacterized Zn-binding protein involved in type VI secretion